MKKILLPLDGTERSKKTITWIIDNYDPKEVELTLMMCTDMLKQMEIKEEYSVAHYMSTTLNRMNDPLEKEGFTFEHYTTYGKPGEEIVKYAKENGFDLIVMTKSTKKGWLDTIGSVTAYTVKYAPCAVLIIPEC
jgi:nucleotide-binding universal stress UspA family protein